MCSTTPPALNSKAMCLNKVLEITCLEAVDDTHEIEHGRVISRPAMIAHTIKP